MGTNHNPEAEATRPSLANGESPLSDAMACADNGDDATLEGQLNRSKANRRQAETVRRNLSNNVLEVTRQVYQQLVDDGQRILEQAKKIEAEAEKKLGEAHTTAFEADAYREKVLNEAATQAEEILIKAHLAAEEDVASIKMMAAQELEQARVFRSEADAHWNKIVASASAKADKIESLARSTAEKECLDLRQRATREAEAIRAAALEEYNTLQIYAEAARLEAEDRDALPATNAFAVKPSQVVQSNELHEAPLKLDQPESNDAVVPEQPELERPQSEVSAADAQFPDRLTAINPPTGQASPVLDKPDVGSGGKLVQLDGNDDVPRNEPVLGLIISGRAKAYPTQSIVAEQIINDCVAGVDILVTLGLPPDIGMIFNRKVDDRTLIFGPWPGGSNDLVLMRDRET